MIDVVTLEQIRDQVNPALRRARHRAGRVAHNLEASEILAVLEIAVHCGAVRWSRADRDRKPEVRGFWSQLSQFLQQLARGPRAGETQKGSSK